MARQAVNRFSRELQTKISIKRVKISPFNRMYLEGFYLEDQKKDTLLSAGVVEVRITDWFFFKDKADLKYIGLKDAVINMNRTDSVWNYDFLKAYFSTPTSPKKKSAGITFNLQKIYLENVAFAKKDGWLGNNLMARVGALDMDVQDLSISEERVAVSNVSLTNPLFHIYDYPGKYRDSSVSASNWQILVNNVTVENGTFRLDNGSLTPTVAYFDTEHLLFSNINGNVKSFSLKNDVVKANVNLSTLERSGLQIKSLRTDFTFGPKELVFDNLFLQTNRSRISNYFAMHFNSTKDLGNFLTDVKLTARFNGSYISSDDLAYFDPGIKNWKKNFRVTGNVNGTVAALRSHDLDLWAGNSTHLQGAVSVVGLPNINRAYFNINARDLRTTHADLLSFAPDLKNVTTPNLRKLGYLQFAGTFKGRLDDFATNGTIRTNLGTIDANLVMKLPARGEPSFSGTLSTEGFQLGAFLKDNKLGIVDFHGTVAGRSFKWPQLTLNVNGVVHRIKYDDYTYQNITVKGTMSNARFNGDFAIKDPNADLRLAGIIDLSGKVPAFNAKANVTHINLKNLGLTDDAYVINGIFDVNLSGNSITNLLGTARVSDATILHEGERLSFDSLYLSSTIVAGVKNFRAVSNEFDIALAGNFDLGALPASFQLFLNRYYPSIIKRPARIAPQDFTFDIKTGYIEEYLKLVDKNLRGLNNSEINGSLNTTASTMTIKADVPFFAYKNFNFSDIILNGSGTADRLEITGEATNSVIDSNFVFPTTNFSIVTVNDVSDVTLQTTSNQAVDNANLSARVTTNADGFTVDVNPSTFLLNGKTWRIEEGGELVFRKGAVVHGELVLREAQQEIVVRSAPSSIGNWNDLHVHLNNINLNDLSPLLLPSNRLEGSLSGDITIEDPENKFLVSGTVTADQLKLDNDSLGQLTANISYDKRTGLLVARGRNADPEHNISFDVGLNFQNPSRDRISLTLNNFQMNYLERFLGEIFTNIKGFATGTLNITKAGDHMDFTGKFRIRDASMKVVFTQVTYTIEDTEIVLQKDYLNLNGIRIRDAEGRIATVSGGISHQGWANMDYDISVQTVTPNMELLNTTYKDNQIFYGRAYGSGSFVLVGPEYDMNMFIDMRASDVDSSWITLPPARSRETGQASFMVEKKYGVEMTPTELRGGRTNLTYDVRMTATPMLNMQVILDELTGDNIRGRGTGTLDIHSGTSAPLTISGRINIDEGNYLYTFQSVLKKPFILRKGANNYIEWTRDPYDAKVNIEATYTAEQVSFAPVAAFDPTLRNLAQLRDNVNVVAFMTGELFQPNFSFKLEFPRSSGVFNNPAVSFAIQQLENNPNELYKQVTYLIVFNSFAPYQNTPTTVVNPLEEFTFNTASALFFNVLNRELNSLFTRIFRNNKFTFNFSGSVYNRNLIDPNARGIRLFNQVASNLSVGTSLFNERAIFTVGGTFNVPLENNLQQNFQILPDVTLEVLLNKTGSVRATFFYRQNVDFIYGSTTSGSPTTKRFGAGVSYNREFDTLSEMLFGSRRRRQQVDTLPIPAQPADSTRLGQ